MITEQIFDKFLTWLQPLKSEHGKGISHKSSVERCLVNHWARTRLFETGSFGNGTGVRHFSDTDYFAICPEDAFYTDSGVTLRRMKETLQGTFPQTLIEVKTPAVRVSFGVHASEILEVTPASYAGFMDTPDGKRRGYYIPDYEGGWMLSCPAAHNAFVLREDKRLKGKLKPLIRLVKAWKFYNQVPITSFYLELRVAKYAAGRKSLNHPSDIRNIMKLLYDNQLAKLQDPVGISGHILACKSSSRRLDALSKLNTGYKRAAKACENGDTVDGREWWRKFYCGEFPRG